jgi:hypothetical protein
VLAVTVSQAQRLAQPTQVTVGRVQHLVAAQVVLAVAASFS